MTREFPSGMGYFAPESRVVPNEIKSVGISGKRSP
jgi:hypothetical protein